MNRRGESGAQLCPSDRLGSTDTVDRRLTLDPRAPALNNAARSANPAQRLTRPSPVTAPRTKLSFNSVARNGTASTARFRSQKLVHGITASASPTSMKYATRRRR